MTLEGMGWNSFFAESFAPFSGSGLIPARIVSREGNIYSVETAAGRIEAPVAGHFSYIAAGQVDYPAAGDWVLIRETSGVHVIERVLERKSRFSRRTAGRRSDEQVIAANIDIMFITASLDGGRNFNLRAIERYMVMVSDSGAEPVIVLNKCDLCADTGAAVNDAESVAGVAPVLLVSALTGLGIDKLAAMTGHGVTAAFTGPSGVGKSALVNYLLGRPVQRTGKQRADDLRGRHTTTTGGLFFTSAGGIIIDTPGLRELKPYGDTESLDDAFPEIADAGSNCRFRDCTHTGEPGCAVMQMVDDGVLDEARYLNYVKIREEMEFLDALKSEKGRMERKAKEKSLSKLVKNYHKSDHL
ncbi:MAG TPA: ribosome small subunit-dependent GTPase A [Spirochaetota bacterium]|nr:ribosome small subunit-dependent GTPase A [Spirochaetota bacterium]